MVFAPIVLLVSSRGASTPPKRWIDAHFKKWEQNRWTGKHQCDNINHKRCYKSNLMLSFVAWQKKKNWWGKRSKYSSFRWDKLTTKEQRVSEILCSPAAGHISGTEKPLSAHSSNIPGRRTVGLGGRQKWRQGQRKWGPAFKGLRVEEQPGASFSNESFIHFQLCEEELQHEPFVTDAQRSVISQQTTFVPNWE